MRMYIFVAVLVMGFSSVFAYSPSPLSLTVECPQPVNLLEGQSYDTTVTGLPKIIENDGGAITITYLEYYTKGNCSNKNDVVTRIFTIRNAKGDLQRCNQSIFLKHRTINEIRFPTDTTVSYPKNGSFVSAILGVPDELGGLVISFSDTKLSSGCASPVRIRRVWTITDRCTGAVNTRTSLINVLNYQNSFEHQKVVEDDLCDEEGLISISPLGEFGAYTYAWSNGATTSLISNLKPGIYSVVITDKFKCNTLVSFGLESMSVKADVGGRIVTQNDYRVYPDSIYITDAANVKKFCLSANGGLHYGFTVKKRNSGFMEYRLVKRSDPVAGISTKDVLLIQKHILGIERFSDTLKYFAADVNNNFNVTASDMTELRRLILGIKDNFTAVLPWYFLRTDWKQVISPFQSFQSIQFKGIQIVNFPRQNADILALKMGDIDLSYRQTFTGNQLTQRLMGISCKLIHGDVKSLGNQMVEVPFYLSATKDIMGLQFALNLCGNGDEMHSIIPMQIPEDHIYLKANTVTVSHSTGLPLVWDPQKPVFAIRCKVERLNNLTALFCMNDKITAEYYDNQLAEWGLELIQQGAVNSEEKSYFLSPQPVREMLHIRSKEIGFSNFSIFTSDGRKLEQLTFESDLDYPVAALPSGFYFYRIEKNSTIRQSGRFVVVK